MATFYLINTTIVGTKKYFPGDLLNDAIHQTADITAAGGILWPSSDATVATAATTCANRRKSRAADEFELQAIMAAATMSSLKAGGSIAAATPSAPGTMSAADKTRLDAAHVAAGTALTDADQDVEISGGAWRTLPTLTGNRTKTLLTTGAVAGTQITITRTSTAANTCAIVNGGAGAGTLHTFPVSAVGFVKVQFDGTNWALREVG